MPHPHYTPLPGASAPDFTVQTTHGSFTLQPPQGKWLVLFAYPGDFIPVCATELMSLAEAAPQLEAMNTSLLALAPGTVAVHVAWVISLYRSTSVMFPYPIAADDGSIARAYGVQHRALFIIDPAGVIRAALHYPAHHAICTAELLRLLHALQAGDAQSMATPANWHTGDPLLFRPPETLSDAMNAQSIPERYCTDWYLCYDKPPLLPPQGSGKY